jgi:hypothetical protein
MMPGMVMCATSTLQQPKNVSMLGMLQQEGSRVIFYAISQDL